MDNQFAAARILKEVFDNREDCPWMSVLVDGAWEIERSSGKWLCRYRILPDKIQLNMEPPDSVNYMHIRNEDRDFELADPKVFDRISEFVDNWIAEKEKQ